MDHFGNKWSMIVIITLAGNGTMRFNELGRNIVGISQKMLTSTLQTLEKDGFLTRTMFQKIPTRVEYQLTELGFTLLPLIENVAEWSTQYVDEIKKVKSKKQI